MADPTKFSTQSTWLTDVGTNLTAGALRSISPIARCFTAIGTWASAVHDTIYATTTGLEDKVAVLESATRNLLATSLTVTGEVQAEHLHTTDDLQVDGDATVAGNLTVTTATTLSGPVTANGGFVSTAGLAVSGGGISADFIKNSAFGSIAAEAIAADGIRTVTLTFPTDRFTVAPAVVAMVSNSTQAHRYAVSVNTISTTGCTVSVHNGNAGSASPSLTWIAVAL